MDPLNPADGSTPEGTQQATQGQPDPFSAVQKRIDELIAKQNEDARAWERKTMELQEQNQQLLAQLIQRQAPAAPAEPAPELDDEERKKLGYYINQAVAPIQQQYQRLAQNHYTSQVYMTAQQLGVTEPEILAKAQALVQQWAQAGYLDNGTASIKNAFQIVAGDMALQERQTRQAEQAKRAAFNSMGGPITASHLPPAGSKPPPPDITMEDIERDPAAAAAALEARMRGQSL